MILIMLKSTEVFTEKKMCWNYALLYFIKLFINEYGKVHIVHTFQTPFKEFNTKNRYKIEEQVSFKTPLIGKKQSMNCIVK